MNHMKTMLFSYSHTNLISFSSHKKNPTTSPIYIHRYSHLNVLNKTPFRYDFKKNTKGRTVKYNGYYRGCSPYLSPALYGSLRPPLPPTSRQNNMTNNITFFSHHFFFLVPQRNVCSRRKELLFCVCRQT